MNSAPPYFSLVVPHDRSRPKPERFLTLLTRLPGPEREVIPVAYGPPGPDGDPQAPRYSGQARNLGLNRARGAVVVFLEPDCILPHDLLTRLSDNLADPGVTGVGAAWQSGEADLYPTALAAMEFAHANQEAEQAGYPLLHGFCAAFQRKWLLTAGGLEPREGQGGGALVSLCRRLTALGARLVYNPELGVRRGHPASWAELAQWEILRGEEVFASRRQRPADPGPPLALPAGLLAQVALALGSVGIPLVLGGRMPGNAATLAALCLLLLYPLNRGFLRFVSQKRPGLLNRAIFFCVLRPFLWCLGLASAAVDRLLSGGVKQPN